MMATPEASLSCQPSSGKAWSNGPRISALLLLPTRCRLRMLSSSICTCPSSKPLRCLAGSIAAASVNGISCSG